MTSIGQETKTTQPIRHRRWRPVTWLVLVVLPVVTLLILAALLPADSSSIPLAGDNPGPSGAKALIEVLRKQGVEVELTHSRAAAAAITGPDTTLAIVHGGSLGGSRYDEFTPGEPNDLTERDLAELTEHAGRIVLVAPSDSVLARLTDSRWDHEYVSSDGLIAPANCTDPDAAAAGHLALSEIGLIAAGDTDRQGCFTDESGVAGYVVTAGPQPGQVLAIIEDAGVVANRTIRASDGRAALALRSLGHLPRLIWFVPDPDSEGLDSAALPALLPPWFGPSAAMLVVAAAAAALWRGRRIGALVSENLPVVVPASQLIHGLGALYQRGQSRGHAAAALRAGAIAALAGRLGLQPTDPASSIVQQIAAARCRDPNQISELLYGPPPTTNAALVALANALENLIKEIKHD